MFTPSTLNMLINVIGSYVRVNCSPITHTITSIHIHNVFGEDFIFVFPHTVYVKIFVVDLISLFS